MIKQEIIKPAGEGKVTGKDKTMNTETKTIKVLKQSAKGALLITDGETKCWIQSRMMRADGSLTPAGEKALTFGTAYSEEEQSRIEEAIQRKAERVSRSIVVHGLSTSNLEHQTEKAALFKINGIKFWIPKRFVEVKQQGNKGWEAFKLILPADFDISQFEEANGLEIIKPEEN